MTLKIKFKKNDKVIQTALLPLLNITFVCHPSKYQTNWPCRAWKITNFVRVFEKRHFLRKVGNQWKFDKKCFSQKNAKLNPKTKTAARFYNILSCFSPNTIPILAFVIEILSIVQAQLVWQKRVWNCGHFSMFTIKRRRSSELTLKKLWKKKTFYRISFW